MKKQLLATLVVLLSLFATQSIYSQTGRNQGGISIKGASLHQTKYNQTTGGTKITGSQAVTTTTTSTCMSINLPVPATWSLSNYGTGTPFAANGFVNGPNTYADREKAMYFDASATANTLLTQVYVGFDIAYSATPTKTVAIKVYDGSTGSPGAALGSGTLSMATIMSDVSSNQYSLIIFGTPITLPVSKKFFVSVDVSGLQWTSTVKDSLSIVSNTHPQSTPSPTWEKWSTNAWYQYGAAPSWTLNISLLIHPFLTQAPITASMSVSANTICAGKTVTYSSTGSTAGTYEWDFGTIPTPTATGASTTATYPSTGTFTTYMIVSDACGSLGITSKTISVIPNPTVSATPAATTVCNGTNITLNGGGATSYAWTGGVSNGVAFAATSTTNYTVTGTAANGCTATAVAAVTTNTNPVVTANTTTNNICSGNNITLTGGGASTYTWTGGVTNGTPFAPTSTNSYTVNGTAANSCTGTAVVSVTVSTTPTVGATPASTTVCNGSNVTFNGSGASTYAWTGGITDATPFAATSSGNYTVTGTAANGCTATAVASLSVNALPNVSANASSTLVCTGASLTLTGGGASTYTWSNGVSDGVAFAPSTSNVYTVSGTNSNGCVNTATVSITVSTCTGIDKVAGNASYLNVYPNPNNGEFTVYTSGANAGVSIEIYNSVGQLVYSELIVSDKQTLNLNIASGIYFAKLKDNNHVLAVQKVLVN